MAQVTIAQLPQATLPLSGLELIPIVQNGVTKQALTGSLIALNSGVTSLTGTTNQVIVSNPTGAVTLSLPQNINSGAAPVFVGTNFTNIPNSAISNSSITIGSTNIALGGTALTIAGLTSLTSGSLAANGSISGSSAVGAISIGTLTYSDTNTFESLQTNVNSYAQLVLQNSSSGAAASTDIILSNNLGTASTYYGNVGINSSGYTGSGSYNLPNATYLSSTTGDLSIGTTTSNAIHLFVNNSTTDSMTLGVGQITVEIPGVSSNANPFIVQVDPVLPSTATGSAVLFRTLASTSASSFTSSNIYHYLAAQGTIGAGSTVTNQFGYTAASSLIGATNNYGFSGLIPSGATNWNLYMSGTAKNYLAGNLLIGSTTDGGQQLQVTGTSSFTGQITSTVAIGTAPFVIASTTNVPNLNASSLNGATFAAPGTIGNTTASAGNFTSINATGLFTPSTTNGIKGTTLGDSANAGSVGEYATATSTAVSLTTGTSANATSVSLTAGDWDVWGVVDFIPAGTTTTSGTVAGISTASSTFGALGTYVYNQYTGSAGNLQLISAPMQRVNVSSTTTVYLVAQLNFAVSTATCNGYIYARRRR